MRTATKNSSITFTRVAIHSYWPAPDSASPRSPSFTISFICRSLRQLFWCLTPWTPWATITFSKRSRHCKNPQGGTAKNSTCAHFRFEDYGIFHPTYGKLGPQLLFQNNKPLLLLSATCRPVAVEAIKTSLKMTEKTVVVILFFTYTIAANPQELRKSLQGPQNQDQKPKLSQ
ncbi:hypothetical protein VP01_1176g1, partial [Puccinia sorghi]